jgi:hypothetical protein
MTCDKAREYFLAHSLGEPVPSEVTQHLADCAECARELEAFTAAGEMLGSLRPVSPRPGFADAVMAEVAETESSTVGLFRRLTTHPALGIAVAAASVAVFVGVAGLLWVRASSAPGDVAPEAARPEATAASGGVEEAPTLAEESSAADREMAMDEAGADDVDSFEAVEAEAPASPGPTRRQPPRRDPPPPSAAVEPRDGDDGPDRPAASRAMAQSPPPEPERPSTPTAPSGPGGAPGPSGPAGAAGPSGPGPSDDVLEDAVGDSVTYERAAPSPDLESAAPPSEGAAEAPATALSTEEADEATAGAAAPAATYTFSFDGTTLEEALGEVSQATGVHIELRASSHAEVRVHAALEDVTADEAVRRLSGMAGLQADKVPADGYLVRGDGAQ